MDAFAATLGAGLALAGALAVTASWSRGAHAGWLPRLGVGLAPALGSALGMRLAGRPLWLAVVPALVAGGVFGWAGARVQAAATGARVRGRVSVDGPGRDQVGGGGLDAAGSRRGEMRDAADQGRGGMPLAGDLALLAGGLGLLAALTPRLDVPVAATLLGAAWPDRFAAGISWAPASWAGASWTGDGSAWGALLLGACLTVGGVAVAVLLARVPASRLSVSARWVLAGAAAAVLGLLAASPYDPGLSVAPAQPLGLALAAAAAAMAARQPLRAGFAGALLGVALTLADAAGLPAAAVAAVVLGVLLVGVSPPLRRRGGEA